jgi:16S rRNA processing protein RimM
MASSPQASQPRFLLIGEILRPHGIAGEVRMRVLTHYPEHLADLEKVYLSEDPDAADGTSYVLEQVRMHQQYALLKLKGVDTRDQAERIRQLWVMIEANDAVPLKQGELYLYQLIGLRVMTQAGRSLGSITDILETGANDVYIVQSSEHGEILIPATAETIITTDLDAGIMVVNPPEGLLPPV